MKKKRNKMTTIPVVLNKDDRKKIDVLCKKFGIKIDQFLDRAVFETLYELSHSLEPRDRMEMLKRILDKDIDLCYYETRVEAIKELLDLEHAIG